MKVQLHICIPFFLITNKNCIGGLMISMLISSVMVKLRHAHLKCDGQTKTIKLLHFTMQVALRSESKSLSQNQDNLSEWINIFTYGLFFL